MNYKMISSEYWIEAMNLFKDYSYAHSDSIKNVHTYYICTNEELKVYTFKLNIGINSFYTIDKYFIRVLKLKKIIDIIDQV